MAIMEAIAAIGPALATAKQLKDVNAEFDKTELKAKVSELSDALYDAKDALRDASEQVATLEAKLKISREMNWVEPFYWHWSEEDGSEDGPFCQLCWDNDAKQIRIIGPMNQVLKCAKCGTNYPGLEYVPPEPVDVAALSRKIHGR